MARRDDTAQIASSDVAFNTLADMSGPSRHVLPGRASFFFLFFLIERLEHWRVGESALVNVFTAKAQEGT